MRRMTSQRQPTRIAGPASSGGWRLSGSALWRTWALVGWVGTLAAVAWGMTRLERYVSESQPRVPCRLEWVDLPSWLRTPENEWVLRLDVEPALSLGSDSDIHDPDVCRRVGQRLAASPWVAEVQRVSKQADGVVRVQASFREPVALVEVKGRAYPVDHDGVRLPREWNADQVDQTALYVITGVTTAIPDIGAVWEGKDPKKTAPELAAGLKLVEFLRTAYGQGRLSLALRSSLRALNVANVERRVKRFDGKLRIRTIHPRGYINWGEAPGEELGVEPSAKRKLDMLMTVFVKQGGQLPDGRIDLSDPKGEGVDLDSTRHWD